MGRTKSYDRDELIGQAMELFRDNGFAATSTQMLVDELGINRFSLYAEFGSKQALFYEALKRYNHDVIEVSFGLLEAPTASVGEIEALLTFYGTGGEGRALGRGCLLCNTAIEFGYQDPEIVRYFLPKNQKFQDGEQ
ncbi:MAG: TetR/AcrR family transcriptional regulator [Pseudomonadota bacterium]